MANCSTLPSTLHGHTPGGKVSGIVDCVDVWFSEEMDLATFTMPQGLFGEYYNLEPQNDNGSGGWTAFDSLANLNALLDPLTPDAMQILHQAIDFPVGGGNDGMSGNPLADIGVDVGDDYIVAR